MSHIISIKSGEIYKFTRKSDGKVSYYLIIDDHNYKFSFKKTDILEKPITHIYMTLLNAINELCNGFTIELESIISTTISTKSRFQMILEKTI